MAGIEDAQGQDGVGRASLDERTERSPDQEVGHRARRVEAAAWSCARRRSDAATAFASARGPARTPARARRRRRAARRRGRGRRCGAGRSRDAEVPSASTASAAARSGQLTPFGQRRPRGREQPPVERRHPQVVGVTADVREPRHGLQRAPDAARPGIGQSADRRGPRRCTPHGRRDATSAPAGALRRRAGRAGDTRW